MLGPGAGKASSIIQVAVRQAGRTYENGRTHPGSGFGIGYVRIKLLCKKWDTERGGNVHNTGKGQRNWAALNTVVAFI